jgi:hypothetical protein
MRAAWRVAAVAEVLTASLPGCTFVPASKYRQYLHMYVLLIDKHLV